MNRLTKAKPIFICRAPLQGEIQLPLTGWWHIHKVCGERKGHDGPHVCSMCHMSIEETVNAE